MRLLSLFAFALLPVFCLFCCVFGAMDSFRGQTGVSNCVMMGNNRVNCSVEYPLHRRGTKFA